MSARSELEAAFDDAIAQVAALGSSEMKAAGGEPARPYLEKLEAELRMERGRALERGMVDRAWFQATVRWLVDWAPESDLTLIAALGRIVRASPSPAT